MGRRAPLIALLSDFGLKDAYVAGMKGVLLSACPGTPLLDISHDIAPGNILSAAYVLFSVWERLPGGTVVLAVVDPGVGTERGLLAAEAGGRWVIAPDNGLISFLKRRYGEGLTAYTLKTDFLKTEPSATFHGRDVFAPAAALLARGKRRAVLGPPLAPVVLDRVFSVTGAEGTVQGRIIHLDRFGNAVTSIRAEEIPDRENAEIEFVARGRFVKEPYRVRLNGVLRTYADVAPGRPLVYTGSQGFLEIGVRDGSAAEKMGLRQNAPVRVTIKSAGVDAPDRPPVRGRG